MKPYSPLPKTVKIGLALFAVSLLVLLGIEFSFRDNIREFELGISVVNFIVGVAYAIVVIMRRSIDGVKGPYRIQGGLLILILSISCYTLNYDVTIFSDFTNWMLFYIVIMHISYLLLIFIEYLPNTLRLPIYFLNGLSIILCAYFTLYLLQFVHVGLIGMILFGLGVHIFIPCFMLISMIRKIHNSKPSKLELITLYVAALLPLIGLVYFLVRWESVNKEVHKTTASIITRPNNDLPQWVLLCQNMKNDAITKKIVASDLMHDSFDWFTTPGIGTFGETITHDPLVIIAESIIGNVDLDDNTRVKILKSQYNARHKAQRKLWSSKDLRTTDVLNNIRIIPEYRMAYTEKILTISNSNQWESNQQEAAYTFYMPEGSVAASLSLWIDGKEEKSRLTTKSKADSAYATIVGVEQRDPALLHWQEGNTVTVTVFPCTPKEKRTFKIGIVSPLLFENDKLTYQSIFFEGPNNNRSRETTVLKFSTESPLKEIETPGFLNKEIENNYNYTGDLQAYYEISCNAPPLKSQAFVFQGNAYQMRSAEEKRESILYQNIYLDINKSWNSNEFEALWQQIKDKKVFAAKDKFILLNKENHQEVFVSLKERNFSLFPFHKISGANNLVISKSTETSPNLDDLEETLFAESLIKSFQKSSTDIHVLHIGQTISPYLKTLKELQCFKWHNGSAEEINSLISDNTFITVPIADNEVHLPSAEAIIAKTSVNQKDEKTNDNLMRLYSYNKIMQDLGTDYFNLKKIEPAELVAEASTSYIVTPVSSLIVLETKKDYDRFGIEENKNSLKNASVSSSGAVPEPHEWMLIILFGGLVLFLSLKQKGIL
jgi:XrtN system VIT domain protein